MADRPASKGLGGVAVMGAAPPTAAPPTRSGTSGGPGTAGRLATGARTRTGTAVNPVKDALAQQLIKRMRTKFGDAAADIKGQEIISQEVLGFMSKAQTGKLKEEDISLLQERIRFRLAGGTPIKSTLAADKKAQQEGDDWAKIFEYHIAAGQLKDKSEAEIQKEKQRQLKLILDEQIRIKERQKQAEHENEISYFQQEQAGLKVWESQEEAKRQLQIEIMQKLKGDRQVQLDERRTRRDMVLEKRRQEEERTAAKIAYQTRAEFEKEEAARLEAKEALKNFLIGNEANKTLREEAKQQVWAQDANFQRQWEAILDKQERERTSRLEKLKAIQSAQAEIAKTRPEAKRWLDQAIIDRYYKEKEDERAAEEERRKAKVKDGAKHVTCALDQQMKEREAKKEQLRKEEEERARQLAAKVIADEQREQERRAAEAAKKLRIRMELENQMKDNATRRRIAPMSETEKMINTSLLRRVGDFTTTGRVEVDMIKGGPLSG